MQSEIAGIKASVEALRKVLETNKQTLARLEKEKALKESTQQQLLDEYDLARENYATLSKKYQDASINVGARSTDLKMITPAVVPERPFKPRIVLNIILAAGFGLLLSVGLSFLLHNLETPKVVREVEFPCRGKDCRGATAGQGCVVKKRVRWEPVSAKSPWQRGARAARLGSCRGGLGSWKSTSPARLLRNGAALC